LTHLIWSGVVSATPRRTFVFHQNALNPLSVLAAFDSSALAILPISVDIPVLKTTARARPLVTCEPEKTRHTRSLDCQRGGESMRGEHKG
jgi:hypothetical protein